MDLLTVIHNSFITAINLLPPKKRLHLRDLCMLLLEISPSQFTFEPKTIPETFFDSVSSTLNVLYLKYRHHTIESLMLTCTTILTSSYNDTIK